ncbi:MAG: polysaccharide biosynthesis/export family protein, partial [Vulcanimicrobiaceae bacterium]
VAVAGRTPDQAAEILHNRLLKYVRHPVVTVAITQLAQPTVLVLGVVKTPGKYQLRSDARLSDAIAAAGGLGDNINGEYPDARISGPHGDVTSVSLQKLLRGGQSNLDQRLGEGSVVYVPGPMQFNVNVSGAVDHPGVIAVNEGDRLSMAIAKAGNSMSAQSDLNHIRILRTDANGQHQDIQVNLYDALKGGNMNADVALQKNDTIFVPQARQRASKDAWLSGFFYTLTRFIPIP